MKLVQLSGNNRGGHYMERVPLFNPSELLWRYPLGFQPSPHSYPQLDFKTHLPNSLASDPRLWSREDVVVFLRWCEYEFDLPRFDMDFFQMNGKALCLLTKSDLNERSPGCGDVLHNVLHMLMRDRLPSSPITPHFPLTPSWTMPPAIDFPPTSQNSVTLSPAPSLDSQGSPRQPDQTQPSSNNNSAYTASGVNYQSGQSGSSGSAPSDSEGEEPNSPTVRNSLSSPQPQSPATKPQIFFPSDNKPQIFFPSDNISEPNTNGRLLWDFLQQLLNDSLQRYTSYIAWKNREAGVFKIVDPPGLAKLWGIQKNHLSMNYDKMSRALRYYYRVNILRKVQGERHCYQFLRNPSELKSIKHISLLRNQIGSQQSHPSHPPTSIPPQQQCPPPQSVNSQSLPPPPTSSSQVTAPTIVARPLKTEFVEEEPTDLSTHSHCNGNSSSHSELSLSVHGDDYQTAQAEDLSLSQIKSEAP